MSLQCKHLLQYEFTIVSFQGCLTKKLLFPKSTKDIDKMFKEWLVAADESWVKTKKMKQAWVKTTLHTTEFHNTLFILKNGKK